MQDITISTAILFVASCAFILLITALYVYKMTARKTHTDIIVTAQDYEFHFLKGLILSASNKHELHESVLQAQRFKSKYRKEAWLDFAMLMEFVEKREKDLTPRNGWPDFVENYN